MPQLLDGDGDGAADTLVTVVPTANTVGGVLGGAFEITMLRGLALDSLPPNTKAEVRISVPGGGAFLGIITRFPHTELLDGAFAVSGSSGALQASVTLRHRVAGTHDGALGLAVYAGGQEVSAEISDQGAQIGALDTSSLQLTVVGDLASSGSGELRFDWNSQISRKVSVAGGAAWNLSLSPMPSSTHGYLGKSWGSGREYYALKMATSRPHDMVLVVSAALVHPISAELRDLPPAYDIDVSFAAEADAFYAAGTYQGQPAPTFLEAQSPTFTLRTAIGAGDIELQAEGLSDQVRFLANYASGEDEVEQNLDVADETLWGLGEASEDGASPTGPDSAEAELPNLRVEVFTGSSGELNPIRRMFFKYGGSTLVEVEQLRRLVVNSDPMTDEAKFMVAVGEGGRSKVNFDDYLLQTDFGSMDHLSGSVHIDAGRTEVHFEGLNIYNQAATIPRARITSATSCMEIGIDNVRSGTVSLQDSGKIGTIALAFDPENAGQLSTSCISSLHVGNVNNLKSFRAEWDVKSDTKRIGLGVNYPDDATPQLTLLASDTFTAAGFTGSWQMQLMMLSSEICCFQYQRELYVEADASNWVTMCGSNGMCWESVDEVEMPPDCNIHTWTYWFADRLRLEVCHIVDPETPFEAIDMATSDQMGDFVEKKTLSLEASLGTEIGSLENAELAVAALLADPCVVFDSDEACGTAKEVIDQSQAPCPGRRVGRGPLCIQVPTPTCLPRWDAEVNRGTLSWLHSDTFEVLGRSEITVDANSVLDASSLNGVFAIVPGKNQVIYLDPEHDVEVTIPTGAMPTKILDDGQRIYVLNSMAGTVSAFGYSTVGNNVSFTPYGDIGVGYWLTDLVLVDTDTLAVLSNYPSALWFIDLDAFELTFEPGVELTGPDAIQRVILFDSTGRYELRGLEHDAARDEYFIATGTTGIPPCTADPPYATEKRPCRPVTVYACKFDDVDPNRTRVPPVRALPLSAKQVLMFQDDADTTGGFEALDGDGFRIMDTFQIPGEPRDLKFDPGTRRLVATFQDDQPSACDLSPRLCDPNKDHQCPPGWSSDTDPCSPPDSHRGIGGGETKSTVGNMTHSNAVWTSLAVLDVSALVAAFAYTPEGSEWLVDPYVEPANTSKPGDAGFERVPLGFDASEVEVVDDTLLTLVRGSSLLVRLQASLSLDPANLTVVELPSRPFSMVKKPHRDVVFVTMLDYDFEKPMDRIQEEPSSSSSATGTWPDAAAPDLQQESESESPTALPETSEPVAANPEPWIGQALQDEASIGLEPAIATPADALDEAASIPPLAEPPVVASEPDPMAVDNGSSPPGAEPPPTGIDPVLEPMAVGVESAVAPSEAIGVTSEPPIEPSTSTEPPASGGAAADVEAAAPLWEIGTDPSAEEPVDPVPSPESGPGL